MQDDLSKKQAFLYGQIITGGYDPSAFQQFLIGEEKGDNLELWSMDTLIDAVKKFKTEHSIPEATQQIKQTKQQTKKQELLAQNTSDKTVGKQDDKNQPKYFHVIKCQKKKLFPQFLNQKLQIKILKYTKKDGGLFQKSYITYQILVQPLNLRVERRYSDFEWIREKISFLNPGFPVPPISKKGQYRRYDEKHLTKRLIILQMFLNKMASIPQLRSQQILKEFLTLKDTSAWQKLKSKFKGLTSEVEAGRVCNMDGEVICEINKNVTGFLVQSQKYLAEMQPCVKRIYKDFKACATSLQSCSETLKNINKNCKNIWNYDQQFRNSLKLPLFQNNLYSNFQAISEQYSDILLKQAKLFRNQMYGLVKYESLFMVNLIQNLQILGEKQQTFCDIRLNLLKRKMKLYETNDFSKWGCPQLTQKPKTKEQAFGMMLPKQTNDAKKLRDIYALSNRQVQKECLRYFKENSQHMAKYVKNYIQSQSKLNSEAMILWADMLSNAMGMQQGKNIRFNLFE